MTNTGSCRAHHDRSWYTSASQPGHMTSVTSRLTSLKNTLTSISTGNWLWPPDLSPYSVRPLSVYSVGDESSEGMKLSQMKVNNWHLSFILFFPLTCWVCVSPKLEVFLTQNNKYFKMSPTRKKSDSHNSHSLDAHWVLMGTCKENK